MTSAAAWTPRSTRIMSSRCRKRRSIAPRAATLKIYAGRDSERPGLVGQVADAGAGAALLVQRQEGPLVGQVVAVERQVPIVVADAQAHVHDVVGRQLRVVFEGRRRQGAADRVFSERCQIERAKEVVADLREA